MKPLIQKLFVLPALLLLAATTRAADAWPRVVNASDGTTIKVYQPEPESFSGNTFKFRAAISVTDAGGGDPVFGTFWADAKVETDRDNREVSVTSLDVTSIKVPALSDQNKIDLIDQSLESQFPDAVGPISLDEILASLDQNKQEEKMSNDISNKPPQVIYTKQTSMLVLIDGNPKLEHNPDLDMDVVVNTPFTIVRNSDGQFYLYGAKHWYVARSATGPYSYTNDNVPPAIHNVEQTLKTKEAAKQTAGNANAAAASADSDSDPGIFNIVVSTTPAELIQSKGEPNFTPIEGTSLLYMKNTANDIFMNTDNSNYFVLISGRWYTSRSLTANNWQYIPADQLPGDFAKIPEGSPKDNVLASVAGTEAAGDAVMDAQIPQTAKIDRNTASTTVTYNGRPKFTDVPGTDLQYAVNTSSTVIRSGNGRFYVVDNGVWFVSDDAQGPFVVATDRPDDLDRIPPSAPIYNTKYVYVYDVTPDYVYMGYTPGYLNSYIYGPTVVYGTGYLYDPWYDGFYYPRPWSWGFGYGYTPWYGWGFGFGYSLGWFNMGWGYRWGGWCGGWWGPSIYHPSYWRGWYGGPHAYGGFYGNVYNNRSFYNNVHYNNIYRNRGGIVTRSAVNPFPNRAGGGPGGSIRPSVNGYRPGTGGNIRPNAAGGAGGYGNRPSTNGATMRPSSNNVYSDREGNVYQRGSQGWQQRDNRQWNNVPNNRPQVIQNLNRQQDMRSRGEMRSMNFDRARSAPAPSFSRPSGGGFSRPSGGGGGGSRGGGGGGGGRSRR